MNFSGDCWNLSLCACTMSLFITGKQALNPVAWQRGQRFYVRLSRPRGSRAPPHCDQRRLLGRCGDAATGRARTAVAVPRLRPSVQRTRPRPSPSPGQAKEEARRQRRQSPARPAMNRLTQKMSGAQLSVTPLLEPLGFIKALEWIFSIFSFATCGGYSGKTQFDVGCPSNSTVSASFGYPFRLNTVVLGASDTNLICNTTWNVFHLIGDFSSSSQFYVTVAVFAFLYCIGALGIYVGYMHAYRESRKLPLIDFVVTVVFAFLWLVSASAWAKGLSDVKVSTNPDHLINLLIVNCTAPTHCYPGPGPSMGSLNVSVVFGFLNLILWAGNAWFVYKETKLHTPPPDNPTQGAGNVPPSAM